MVITPESMYGINNFSSFIQNNLLLIAGGVAIIALLFMFMKVSTKKPKIIKRSDVQKAARIEELSKNDNTIPKRVTYEDGSKDVLYPKYNYLFSGSKFLGNIINIARREEKASEEKVFYEIVFRPPLIGKIADPFKKNIIIMYEDDIDLREKNKKIVINPEVSIDMHLGVFYTIPHEKEHINHINDNLFKIDKEMISSFYFVESQKKSVLDLETAARMVEKEKELQIELAKKRGKMTSI